MFYSKEPMFYPILSLQLELPQPPIGRSKFHTDSIGRVLRVLLVQRFEWAASLFVPAPRLAMKKQLLGETAAAFLARTIQRRKRK